MENEKINKLKAFELEKFIKSEKLKQKHLHDFIFNLSTFIMLIGIGVGFLAILSLVTFHFVSLFICSLLAFLLLSLGGYLEKETLHGKYSEYNEED